MDKPVLSLGRGVNLLRPGDALSLAGNVAMTNWDLVKRFDPKAGSRVGVGLDGLQVFKWASGKGRPEVYFSTDRSFYSQSLGETVSEGDLLNKHGQVVATNQQLVEAFEPSGTTGFGLDAFDVLGTGSSRQIWFSTGKGFHSDALDRDIGAGDLLSNTGQVIATNAELLEAFQPAGGQGNYGLDTLYVMDAQARTIWFSTTTGFYSQTLKKRISAGTLLSNDGQVVATCRDLMGQFGFSLTACNIDLDAFSIVRTISGGSNGGTANRPPPSTPEPVSLALLALAVPVVLLRRRK